MTRRENSCLFHRHRFRQIPRHVGILPSLHGQEVSQYLNGDDIHDGLRGSGIRHFDPLIEGLVLLRRNADREGAPGLEFDGIRDHVGRDLVIPDKGDARRAVLDQGDRPVLPARLRRILPHGHNSLLGF